jgi:prepilin-type processing-associated H-X9-DG protein
MHPDIQKFWEDAGYKIDSILFDETHLIMGGVDALIYWTVHRLIGDIGNVVAATLGNGVNVYWMDGHKYTENEMLKLIKLKCFL